MHVYISAYDPAWPGRYRAEANRIRSVLAGELVAIHHIGSTSVPGLKAKPVIDIMPVVRDIRRVDDCHGAMTALGYEAMGEMGIPGRRYFRKGGDHRTHQVHVFEEGSAHVDRHLAFRDYLRQQPELAARYAELKEDLARRFPRDIEAYSAGKNEWIKAVEAEALAWYHSR